MHKWSKFYFSERAFPALITFKVLSVSHAIQHFALYFINSAWITKKAFSQSLQLAFYYIN